MESRFMFLLFLVTINLVSSMYTDKDDVVELTEKNFQTSVLDSDEPWLVEFYAPWCGHCKELAPSWIKAAKYLKGFVKVGAVDVTKDEPLGQKYGVQGFPTIKVFGGDKKNPTDYDESRTVRALVGAGYKAIKESLRARMGLKKKKKKGGKGGGGGDAVVKLTAKNFEKEVMEGDDLYLVEFFAPWCGHCKELAPHWKKAAGMLTGKAKLGAVDATIETALATKYKIEGYPTIKVFRKGKKDKPVEYQGGRDANGIVAHVNEILSGGGAEPEEEEKDTGPTSVVTVTDENFKEMVLDSKENWMVEFFAPWCGHCKALAPHWKAAAKTLEGKVKLGAVDCTEAGKESCQKYKIEGFPTIKTFELGNKESPSNFEGGRTTADIVKHGEEMFDNARGPVEVKQLINKDSLAEACGDKTLCLLAFLPHILDSKAEGRNKYIEMLNQAGTRHRKTSIGFLWGEAGVQHELEESIRVGGSGYPAAAVVSYKKKAFVPFTGQFSAQSLKEFVTGIISGNVRPIKAPKGFPEPETVEAWDGKDGALPVDEDDDDAKDGHNEL